jgi:ethanolamine utilization microcompartment shell protein EutS
MEVIGYLSLAALVVKIVGVVKSFGKDWNYVLTQVVTWVAGIAVLAVGAQASVTEDLAIPGVSVPLGLLDGWSTVLVGLVLGSTAAFGYDVKKAIDSTDSAAEPSLLSSGG